MTSDRRKFFRHLARETAVFIDEARGKPQLKLSDLETLPDAEFSRLVPKMSPAVEIVPDETQVHARIAEESNLVSLFPIDEQTLFIFNRFNGRSAITRIADELAAATGRPLEDCRADVRSLFLRLVRLGVCFPH